MAVSFASDVYVSTVPQRFSLILQRVTSNGFKYVSGPAVEVRFKAPGGAWGPFTPLRLDTEGLPENRGIYRTESIFDHAGNWKVQAKVGGSAANSFAQPVAQTAEAPVPGDPRRAPVADRRPTRWA